MKLIINNLENNLIQRSLRLLEDAYKQSNDSKVLNAVKDQLYFSLMAIEGFDERFKVDFDNCKMSSLEDIDELAEKINSNIDVIKLENITEKEFKKLIKLKDRQFRNVLSGYNEAIEELPLTFFSHYVDDKLVLILPKGDNKDEEDKDNKENTILTNIARVKNINKLGEGLCYFCNSFRKNPELVYVTNEKTSKENYNAITQIVCKDYKLCNESILNTDNLEEFILSLK